MKRHLPSALAVAAVLALGLALFSGAWFADDALRLWRISLDWIRFGSPDFNHGERVLSFDQPLWVLLLTGGFALGGSLVRTAVALQFILFCAGTLLIWACHRLTLPPNRTRSWSTPRSSCAPLSLRRPELDCRYMQAVMESPGVRNLKKRRSLTLLEV